MIEGARGRGAGARDGFFVIVTGLVARLLVVAWAARIAPAADGRFYHTVASRIADGQGYTWLWPDGVVTYAAHYPVGYPALIGMAYAAFGASPVVAMIVNACVGAAAGWATHALLVGNASRWGALAGGLVVALHPALVPYTAALMTEGVTVSLLVACAALAARAARPERTRPAAWLVASGVVLGMATLVRPQSIVLAPAFGWLATRCAFDGRQGASIVEDRTTGRGMPFRFPLGRLRGAIVVSAVALLVCAPWTARNCVRMRSCALVSVNGGWNLAIGTQTTTGAWRELVVPEACKNVFDEAAKDTCFGREARKHILADPLGWLARAPRKVAVTLDYFGAAPWYLHEASPEKFPERAKFVLGAVETVASRLLLAGALLSVRSLRGPRRRAREGVTALGIVACFFPSGWIAHLACVAAIALLGRRELGRVPPVVPQTALVIATTAATHAVFFGAGRYGLVVVPFVTALAFVRPGSGSEAVLRQAP